MIPGRTYTPLDWLHAVWKRRWLPVASCLLVTGAAAFVIKQTPYRYRAEALILAESRSVAPEYVKANVTAETMKDRLPTISQQILSRSRLESIVRTLDLYRDIRQAKPIDAVVGAMRQDIQVKVVEGSESFRVSYESEDPDTALRVTEQLVGPFIAESAQARAVLARETSIFLQSQLEQARARLVEQEKRLEAYRLHYRGELPTQLQSNVQFIQNIQLQIQSLGDNLNRDRDYRLLTVRLLADLQTEEFMPEPGAARTNGIAGDPRDKTPLALQLDAAVADLRSLELRVTPQHPDRVRAHELVETLQAKLKTESAATTVARGPTAAENAKRNRIRELQAELESLDRQIQDKLGSQEQLRIQLRSYQARVDTVPSRESELTALTRDYDTLQKVYQTLLAKNEESKISENLERQQVGGQFRIVDPPQRPQTPLGPNRRLLLLGAAAGGFALGLALAVLLQLLDRRLFDTADVIAALNLPVVATIPLVQDDLGRRRQRAWRRAEMFLVAGGFVALCAALWLRVHV